MTRKSEDFVTFNIMSNLRSLGWHIVQYHPPGGQACLALPVNGSVVYPDIIAYKSGKIIISENKPKFDNNDIIKLLEIKGEAIALSIIDEHVRNYCLQKGVISAEPFTHYYIHGCCNSRHISFDDTIHIIAVNENASIELISPPGQNLQL